MSKVGKKMQFLRYDLKIDMEDASKFIGATSEELAEIEMADGDYYYPQLLRCCELYKTNIYFMLDDNSDKTLIFREPTSEDYLKFEESITCVTNLRNPLKRDLSRIKRPECCNKPNARYYGWKILDTKYCFKGVIVLEDAEEFAQDDIIIAIIRQKPVYGKFKAENGKFFIAPITDEKKRLSLTAKGSKVMGIVKHLDIEVN
jgi:hypothetical protein